MLCLRLSVLFQLHVHDDDKRQVNQIQELVDQRANHTELPPVSEICSSN